MAGTINPNDEDITTENERAGWLAGKENPVASGVIIKNTKTILFMFLWQLML